MWVVSRTLVPRAGCLVNCLIASQKEPTYAEEEKAWKLVEVVSDNYSPKKRCQGMKRQGIFGAKDSKLTVTAPEPRVEGKILDVCQPKFITLKF